MPEMLTRNAAAVASSVDVAARTVEAIIASENPVRRRSWEIGLYDEILVCTPQAVDLSRADALAVLDSHDAYSVDTRIGTVVPGSIRFESGKILATLLLNTSERANQILADLEAGHRYGISVGYSITTAEEADAPNGGVATVRAIAWKLLEVSLVSVPADGSAMTRSFPPKDETMPETITNPEDAQPSHISQRAIRAERKRSSDIQAIAALAGLSDDPMVRTALNGNTSVEEFRAAVFDKLIEIQDRTPTFPYRTFDNSRSIVDAMTEALVYRADPRQKPADDAREFVGLSLPELARRSLENAGIRTTGMGASSVMERALHGASDFPTVISNVGQRLLLASYNESPSSLKTVARRATAANFKGKTGVQFSGFSDLEKVSEHGEYRRGTFAEGAESYRLETFGKVFGISRVALINDDLGAFADVSRQLGEAAARLEAKVLADLVIKNPKMADGKAVFHADHKNLFETGSALTLDSLSMARLIIGKQVGLAGELIDIRPRYLVVGLENETFAEKVLAEITATSVTDVNPFAGKLLPVVDRRIEDGSWFLAADPYATPSLEYAYLTGVEGPEFITREGFDTDGVEIKVRLDFGAGWLDHRGWVKNPGA